MPPAAAYIDCHHKLILHSYGAASPAGKGQMTDPHKTEPDCAPEATPDNDRNPWHKPVVAVLDVDRDTRNGITTAGDSGGYS